MVPKGGVKVLPRVYVKDSCLGVVQRGQAIKIGPRADAKGSFQGVVTMG